MGSLAVLLGLDAADRLGGGPADGADVVAGQVDGEVSAATWTVTTWRAWMRPRAIFWPATMMTPVLLARRWTVTGSAEGRGGGPAGRAPRSLRAWSRVSGLGRVRSSSRVAGSKNVRVVSSMRMPTWRPARISPAATYWPPRLTWPLLLTIRSTSIAAPGSAGGSGGGPAGRPPAAARAPGRRRTGASGGT